MFLLQFFRWIGVLTGYPVNWSFFTSKIYYENKAVTNRRIRGGALIIMNHYNPLDYVLSVFLFFPRMLYVVASEHAFKNWLISFGMKFWGGIKADRTTKSVHFITESAKKIKEGSLVEIFPEGHNTDDGTIKPFYPSYLLIAMRANAPIIPVVTDGNYGLFKRIHVMFGEQIDVSQYTGGKRASREDLERINGIVHQKMLDLREELDRRVENDRKKGRKN